jgi:hypothetical protein
VVYYLLVYFLFYKIPTNDYSFFVMLLIEVRMDVEPVSINVDIVQLITRQILLNLEMEE